MYNKKSKASAILAIITAVLIVGFLILLPVLLLNTQLEFGEVIALIIAGLIFGFLPLYASSVPFFIVALVFGIRMLKQQSRNKLISFNKSLLIATCVLLPFIMLGIGMCSSIVRSSATGIIIVIYAIVTALAYLASLITQIVASVQLKKMPEEVVSPVV
ncbi:MAG: hypothetical protein J1F65_02895 [Clostridiales bacterium]|nr:hypothetical protein [Clostridiales bacterium]